MMSQCSGYLPAELWSRILRFTTLEDSVNDDDNLLLLHPTASHKQSISNKRAVVSVCRRWRKLATEYLWESVGNSSQVQLVELAGYLRRDAEGARKELRDTRLAHRARGRGSEGSSDTDVLSSVASSNGNGNRIPRGWWIRSLITRFDFGDDLDTFVSAITAVFPYCPNLTSFTHIHDYNGPLPSSVINSLADRCGRTLVRFQLDWGGVHIDDLIHLLNQSRSLQHIALGCTFNPPSSDLLPPEKRELVKKDFKFERLRTLQFGNSEDGMIYKFNSHLLEAASWNVPSLTTVAIDLDARTSIEEVIGFLQVHGGKLKSLSLTDSGRVEGIPITWSDIFTLCPHITELRTTYSPFVNFNIGAFVGDSDFEGQDLGSEGGEVEAEIEVLEAVVLPELPHLVTSTVAPRLERLCFDQWEFFPGFDCVLRHGGHDGPHTPPIAEPEEFLAGILAHSQGIQSAPLACVLEGLDANVGSQKSSERVLKAYCRVLDNVFQGLVGKMTPALRVIQFDFHASRLDLPESCLEWWNGWVSKWQSMGLRVEGCQRVPLPTAGMC